MSAIQDGLQPLDENNIEIFQKVVFDNLEEFNRRTGDNIQLIYKPNKFSYFERVDKNTSPFNNYFDDYCLSIINWFLSLQNSTHLIENIISSGNLPNMIYEKFKGRKNYNYKEIKLVSNLFTDYYPKFPFLTDSNKKEIQNQMNEMVQTITTNYSNL